MQNLPRDIPPKHRRRSSLWVNIVVMSGGVLVALGLAELALRLLFPLRPPLVITQESRDLFIKSAVDGLVYELRPDFAGRAFGCEVRTNSSGMRSPERAVAKPAGVRRVLILGDSVAFGHGVGQEAVFPALLETMLSDGGTTGRVEVINAAVPGYNSAQQEIALRDKGVAWRPDVVLVAAVVNDAEPAYELRADGSLQWENPPEIYREFIEQYIAGKGTRAFLRRHFRVAALLDRAQPHFLTGKFMGYLDGLYADDSAGWQEAQRAIQAMNELCRARGADFVLAFCPIPEKPEPEALKRIRSKFAEFAKTRNIPFVDLFDAEHSRPLNDVILSSWDRHPSVLGHHLIAEALALAIRDAFRKTE